MKLSVVQRRNIGVAIPEMEVCPLLVFFMVLLQLFPNFGPMYPQALTYMSAFP